MAWRPRAALRNGAALVHSFRSPDRLVLRVARMTAREQSVEMVMARAADELVDAVEDYILWEPRQAGHAAAHKALVAAVRRYHETICGGSRP